MYKNMVCNMHNTDVHQRLTVIENNCKEIFVKPGGLLCSPNLATMTDDFFNAILSNLLIRHDTSIGAAEYSVVKKER